eukprot:GEMP01078785.1.p1 GENE.GEMP01078785.1~~GEMP01078785.1.p1  ORF type:complete len:127 (+),score=29.55 GEMP01078785.1:102-482(+)
MATTTINETNNTYINKLSSTMGRMVELSSNHITSWSTFLLPNQELFLSIKDKALDHAASIDTKFGFWQKLEQLTEGALVKGRVMMKNGKIQGAISYAQHLGPEGVGWEFTPNTSNKAMSVTFLRSP